MLLAGEVKGELARIQPARACCRRAELIGLLHGSGGDRLRTLDHATARTAVHLATSLRIGVEGPRGATPTRSRRPRTRHHLAVTRRPCPARRVALGRCSRLRPPIVPARRPARLGLDLVHGLGPTRRVRPARGRRRHDAPRAPRGSGRASGPLGAPRPACRLHQGPGGDRGAARADGGESRGARAGDADRRAGRAIAAEPAAQRGGGEPGADGPRGRSPAGGHRSAGARGDAGPPLTHVARDRRDAGAACPTPISTRSRRPSASAGRP